MGNLCLKRQASIDIFEWIQLMVWFLFFSICCLCASPSSCQFLSRDVQNFFFPLLSESESVYRKQSLPSQKKGHLKHKKITSSAFKDLAAHLLTCTFWMSQVALAVKNSPANAGDKRCRFAPWASKIPWRRAWQPTPVFLLGESH